MVDAYSALAAKAPFWAFGFPCRCDGKRGIVGQIDGRDRRDVRRRTGSIGINATWQHSLLAAQELDKIASVL